MDDTTTVRVRRRTAHAINTIVGLDEPKATADDIIWRALKMAYPMQMEYIEKLQDAASAQAKGDADKSE